MRPSTFVCRISGELLTENTSAKRALLDLNHTTSLATDHGVPLWANEQGEVLAIDGTTAIAIFEDEVRFSQTESVEAELAYEVIKSMGLKTQGNTEVGERRENLAGHLGRDAALALCVVFLGHTFSPFLTVASYLA